MKRLPVSLRPSDLYGKEVEASWRFLGANRALEPRFRTRVFQFTYCRPSPSRTQPGEQLASSNRNQQQRVSPETLLCQWLILVEALLQELQEFLNCDESSGLAGVDFFDATLKLTGNWCSFWREAKNKCAFHTRLTLSEVRDPSRVLAVSFWWNFDSAQRKMLKTAT